MLIASPNPIASLLLGTNPLVKLSDIPGLEALYDAYDPQSIIRDSVGRVSYFKNQENSGKIYGLLPGVAGNYFSTPDSAAVSVTGDIDLRLKLSMVTWTPATNQVVVNKNVVDGQSSFDFFVTNSAGTVQFRRTATGAQAALVAYTSSVGTGFAANTTNWIRVTYATATGTATFYTSVDGVTWNQLGTPTISTTGNIFDGTDPVSLGGSSAGLPLAGEIYYAEIRNGINGTVVAAFDPTRAQSGASSFVASTGETWTVNTSGTNPARLTRARDLFQGTAGSQPIYLPWSGQNYGYLPGVAGNYFSTPDSAALSITGDIDLRATLMMADWTPSANAWMISKVQTDGQSAYDFGVTVTTGTLAFRYTPTGTFAALRSAVSTVAPTVTNGAVLWIRVTYASATGAVNFYTSTDGVSWTQLGSQVLITSGTIFDGTNFLSVGAEAGGASYLGSTYYAEIRNGIAGTVVAAFDPSRTVDGASSFVAATGETWTVNASGGKPAQIVGRASVLFDGSDDSLKTAAFTLNQPETVYFVGKQTAWVSNTSLFGGNVGNSAILQQKNGGVSPELAQYAGSYGGSLTTFPVGVAGVLVAVFNGTASSLGLNRQGIVTGSVGAGVPGGFELGANGSSAGFSRIQASGIAAFSGAHDARTQARVIDFLIRKYAIDA